MAQNALTSLRIDKKNEYGENLKVCFTDFLNLEIEIADENGWYFLNGEYDRFNLDSLDYKLYAIWIAFFAWIIARGLPLILVFRKKFLALAKNE